MTTYYCVSVRCRNVGLLLGLNDAPVLADVEGAGLSTVRPVNEWIMPAGNRFTAHVFWPGARPFAPAEARVKASLFIGDPASESPKPGKVLAEFNWPLPDQPEAYPYDFAQAVKIDAPPPTRVWVEADAITSLGLADREAITDVVRQLRERLAARDAAGAFDLTRYRYQDEATANGLDFGQLSAVVQEQYGMLGQIPGLRFAPVEPAELTFHTVAENRLVRVTRNSGGTLVADSDEARFRFELYFARVRGAWLIAR